MYLTDWRQWLRELTWDRKWFVILVLIRPVMDVFYELKSYSPFLSPLVLAGAATPILVFLSLHIGRLPKARVTTQDYFMDAFATISLFNVALIAMQRFDFGVANIAAKNLIAPVVYVYLRRFVRSERDFLGIVTAFFVSTAFPLGMMTIEAAVGPIGNTQTARGMTRIEGLYADVISYSTYLNFAFLCAAFFMIKAEGTLLAKRTMLMFILTFSICLVAMVSIKHAASWGVFAALVGWTLINSLNPRSIANFLFVVMIVGGVGLVARGSIQEDVSRLFSTERGVAAGKIDNSRALHGRVSIWKRYWAYWEDSPLEAKILGAGWNPYRRSFEGRSQARVATIMMSGGMHSDFVRLFFGLGIGGLLSYLTFMFVVAYSAFSAERTLRFLILGCVGAMMLYSISTNPLLYASATYLPIAIFAYAALRSE